MAIWIQVTSRLFGTVVSSTANDRKKSGCPALSSPGVKPGDTITATDPTSCPFCAGTLYLTVNDPEVGIIHSGPTCDMFDRLEPGAFLDAAVAYAVAATRLKKDHAWARARGIPAVCPDELVGRRCTCKPPGGPN